MDYKKNVEQYYDFFVTIFFVTIFFVTIFFVTIFFVTIFFVIPILLALILYQPPALKLVPFVAYVLLVPAHKP